MPNLEQFNWKTGVFLITYQLLLIVSLPWYLYHYTPSIGVICVTLTLLCTGGLSITAGYHRLFSHKCYRAHPLIEWIIIFFGSTTIQGSVLRWCYDHRKHHAYVDTDQDPYSISKGFWYAHFFWLLEKQDEIDPKVVSDLIQNKRVMFQQNYLQFWMFGSNLLIFLFFGWFFDDYLGSFFLITLTRIFAQHHSTWFINSLAHTWGEKPFCQEHSAVNNYIISFLTFGEGYHNYHHTFSNDYRNGVHWYQFDPTKWLIWTLSKIGLTWGLKRIDMSTIQKKIVLERKNLLMERLKNLWYIKKDELEKKIDELAELLVIETSKFKELTEKYNALYDRHDQKEVLDQLKKEMRKLKIKIKADLKKWSELSKTILQMKPMPA